MKKYSKQLIIDYVNGNDIVDFDIDELEDNVDFMIDVIKFTKDINLYKLCSDKVKNDYKLILFLIETFKESKKKELLEILIAYEKECKIEIELYEVVLHIVDIYDSLNETRTEYHIIKNMFITSQLKKLDFIKWVSEDEDFLYEYQKGFLLLQEDFKKSEKILDSLALELINQIFSEYNLEFLIHSTFTSKNKIDNMGINNYIIDYINTKDSYLGEYVINHIYLIKHINKKINSIIENWDNFKPLSDSMKINSLVQESYAVLDDSDLLGPITSDMVLMHLGIENKVIDDLINENYFTYDEIKRFISETLSKKGFVLDSNPNIYRDPYDNYFDEKDDNNYYLEYDVDEEQEKEEKLDIYSFIEETKEKNDLSIQYEYLLDEDYMFLRDRKIISQIKKIFKKYLKQADYEYYDDYTIPEKKSKVYTLKDNKNNKKEN